MENITLENLSFKPYYYGFRFGRLDRLKDLQEGHVYMKNLDYFIKEEERTGIPGRGDKDEALMFYSDNVKAYDPETNSLIFTGKAEVRSSNDRYKPVFCMMLKDVYQHPVSLNYPKLITRISFDNKLLDDFSENSQEPYVMIITDVAEFINRIETELTARNLRLTRNFVNYRDTRVIWKNDKGIEFNDAFCKRECFKYQEEFRLLLETQVDDHFEFNIGDIKNITNIIEADSIVRNGINVELYIRELIEV